MRKYWHLTDHLPILEGIGAEVRIGEHAISWASPGSRYRSDPR